mmetsp:Transcript_22112/g.48072  ORF Transcript_22112/g.48072 Transcript_22112/m.48072 type:complete len:277 (+) Transcript_22112:804-1634(+)
MECFGGRCGSIEFVYWSTVYSSTTFGSGERTFSLRRRTGGLSTFRTSVAGLLRCHRRFLLSTPSRLPKPLPPDSLSPLRLAIFIQCDLLCVDTLTLPPELIHNPRKGGRRVAYRGRTHGAAASKDVGSWVLSQVFVWWLSRPTLEHHNAERVHVGRLAVLSFALQHLGGAPQHCPHQGCECIRNSSALIKVGDLTSPILVHQHVERLEVAVEDVLCMQERHATGNVQGAAKTKWPGHVQLICFLEASEERPALHELKDEGDRVCTDSKQLHDVAVA